MNCAERPAPLPYHFVQKLPRPLILFGSHAGEPQQWFVCALIEDDDRQLVELDSLAGDVREAVRSSAAGLLNHIGDGESKILDSHAGVLVFKDLSDLEIEGLQPEAKLEPRTAITKI